MEYESGYRRHIKCCKNGTVWDQSILACVWLEGNTGNMTECTLDYFPACPKQDVNNTEEEGHGEFSCAQSCLYLA